MKVVEMRLTDEFEILTSILIQQLNEQFMIPIKINHIPLKDWNLNFLHALNHPQMK
jgi:hypothetical protein